VAWGSLSQFAAKLGKGTHVQVEGELRYREYQKNHGGKEVPAPIKHRVAEIHLNRILKLDRAEKQDEPGPEVDPSELPADEPTAQGPPTEPQPFAAEAFSDSSRGAPSVAMLS
jgi:single-stranded DNA-binding protein